MTMVAALLFPTAAPAMWKSSVGDSYRVFGIPVMSMCAFIFAVFVIFIDYEVFFNDDLRDQHYQGPGVHSDLYGLALATYFGLKLYRSGCRTSTSPSRTRSCRSSSRVAMAPFGPAAMRRGRPAAWTRSLRPS